MGRLTKYESIKNPMGIESLACRDALALALEKGLSHVIIETDCQNVCNQWINGGAKSVVGQVFREMKADLHRYRGLSCSL